MLFDVLHSLAHLGTKLEEYFNIRGKIKDVKALIDE